MVNVGAWSDISLVNGESVPFRAQTNGELIAIHVTGPAPYLGVTFDLPEDPAESLGAGLTPEPLSWLYGRPMEERLGHFWPSGRTPFRCAAWKTATEQFCISLVGASLEPVYFSHSPPNLPTVAIKADLPAGAKRTYTFRLRRRPLGASLAELLGGYAADFRAAFGEQRYAADPRPVVQWVRLAAHHGAAPAADNPYGWTNWRPDVDGDTAYAWAANVAAGAAAKGFQGAIAWGFAWAPHHADYWGYPVDSRDLSPHGVDFYANYFAAPFLDAGLDHGCLHRAATSQYRDASGPIWATVDGSPASAQRLVERLQRSGALHYFDTTPDVYGVENAGATPAETAAALAAARSICGPTPRWHTESIIDLCLPHAGIYIETTGAVPLAAQVARILYPDCGVLAKDRANLEPADFLAACAANQFAGLVEDWRV